MINTAIICEYNPFHNGHKKQIDFIRGSFDSPVRIIALMSGNFVQRGDLAVADRYERARQALLCGVDLVLELPFPLPLSGAQDYARANIDCLSTLPDIDYLCFGSESGDREALERAAERINTGEFDRALAAKVRENFEIPYASCRGTVYKELYGEELPSEPNDILALEYLSALRRKNSKIKPLVIKRERDFSASGARRAIISGEPFGHLLPECGALYFENNPPVSAADLEGYMIPYLTLAPAEELAACRGLSAELAIRMKNAVGRCGSFTALEDMLSDKRYTRARVRRAVLSAALRLRGEKDNTPPYSILLGCSESGREYLSRHGAEDLAVYSKRSEIKDRRILRSFDRESEANRVYSLILKRKGIEEAKKPFIF